MEDPQIPTLPPFASPQTKTEAEFLTMDDICMGGLDFLDFPDLEPLFPDFPLGNNGDFVAESSNNASFDDMFGEQANFMSFGTSAMDLFSAELQGIPIYPSSEPSPLPMEFDLLLRSPPAIVPLAKPQPCLEPPLFPELCGHKEFTGNDYELVKELESLLNSITPLVASTQQQDSVTSLPAPPLQAPAESTSSSGTIVSPIIENERPGDVPGFPLYPLVRDAHGAPDPRILERLGLITKKSTPSTNSPESSAAGLQGCPKGIVERKRKSSSAKKQELSWHVTTLPEDQSSSSKASELSDSVSVGSPDGLYGRMRRTRTEFRVHGERKVKERVFTGPIGIVRSPNDRSPGSYVREGPLSRIGPHSNFGWALVRMKEDAVTSKGKPTKVLSWSIAQIDEPHSGRYLILSGPYARQKRIVRKFDRMEYSIDNIEKLMKENKRVHAAIAMDFDEIIQKSSRIAKKAARVGIEKIYENI